jgi:sucrose-phosphate synthase
LAFYRQEGALPHAFTAHYADGGLAGALIRQVSGLPFTFTGHSLGAQKMDKAGATLANLAELDARFHFARRIFAERISMNHAGRIVTSTTQERVEQYAHAAYRGAVDPGDPARFAIIPPGVNRRVFSPTPAAEDVAVERRILAALERDIAEGRRRLPLVIASSRLEGKKNHAGLVRAFAASPDLQAVANLAIVVRGMDDPLRHASRAALSQGEKAIMEEITALMTGGDLWGKVTAFPLNSQAELAAAYRCLAQRRSAFCLPAWYEPFGLAPLEAMSCGLPAVVTRNGGPSESLREGKRECGVLIDPASPEDIAQGLLRVLESAEAWAHFQQAGVQRVLSRYTWERTAQGYLDVIEDVLRGTAYAGQLPIPEYFTHPRPETDIPLSDLALYFG